MIRLFALFTLCLFIDKNWIAEPIRTILSLNYAEVIAGNRNETIYQLTWLIYYKELYKEGCVESEK